MAHWLRSAGLQHLASEDQRLPSNLLVQGYGAQTTEEWHTLSRFFRDLNFNGESVSETYNPTTQSLGTEGLMEGFLSPELRGDLGAGLLDLHAMEDGEFLCEHVVPELFETSPFIPDRGFNNVMDEVGRKQQKEQVDDPARALATEKEIGLKENNVPKIKVVVRKRPLNRKEISRKEDDIVTVHDNAYLTVHEPKLKVDLTAYVEKHEFCFDAVLDEHVTNDEVYHTTVGPIIETIFQQAKATCFAYGQTGSGKTFTMQPLPFRAAEDIIRRLHQPSYLNQKFRLWLSYFEIYGGKLFDLLSDRRKLCMREDGRQQVCIVGLQEFEVSDIQIIKGFIEKGNAARTTGSTGANEESSRSHAILQLAIKKHQRKIDSKQNKHSNESKIDMVVGKISFIDLAGSERGADTTDNDRQTRIEGADINKSLLALKECIRALDNNQIHIPFRGSKLTEVLRDSFVGNSRTVMISCISPSARCCEHTLNTLRYADRVKSLSKGSNTNKEQFTGVPLSSPKDSSAASLFPLSVELDLAEQAQDVKLAEPARNKDDFSYNSGFGLSNCTFNGRESGLAPTFLERDRPVMTNSHKGINLNKSSSTQNSFNNSGEEKIDKVSPHRRKITKEEKVEKQYDKCRKDKRPENFVAIPMPQQKGEPSIFQRSWKENVQDFPIQDWEVNEEDALISAHRKEIENTMQIMREEMNLLAEVDRPGSIMDNYVAQLNFLLSRRASGLISLQARLAQFQHRLKEQEILSRKKLLR